MQQYSSVLRRVEAQQHCAGEDNRLSNNGTHSSSFTAYRVCSWHVCFDVKPAFVAPHVDNRITAESTLSAYLLKPRS